MGRAGLTLILVGVLITAGLLAWSPARAEDQRVTIWSSDRSGPWKGTIQKVGWDVEMTLDKSIVWVMTLGDRDNPLEVNEQPFQPDATADWEIALAKTIEWAAIAKEKQVDVSKEILTWADYISVTFCADKQGQRCYPELPHGVEGKELAIGITI